LAIALLAQKIPFPLNCLAHLPYDQPASCRLPVSPQSRKFLLRPK